MLGRGGGESKNSLKLLPWVKSFTAAEGAGVGLGVKAEVFPVERGKG